MRLSEGLGMLVAQLSTRARAEPVVEHIHSTPWASITFSGARHRITLRFDGSEAADALARMTEHLDYAEFDLGRHILADIGVLECECNAEEARVVLEALTVRDG